MGIIAGSRLRAEVFGPEFIIEVDTTNTAGGSNADRFRFTGALGDYDVVAKQGGSVVQTFSNLSDEEIITFINGPGIYVLEVTAKATNGFTGLAFNNSGDRLKLNKINQFGVFNDGRDGLFYGCENLTEISNDVDWLNVLTVSNDLFRDCFSLTSLPEALTFDALTSSSNTFFGCSLTSLPSGMNLNNLVTSYSFFRHNDLTSLPDNMRLDNLSIGVNMFDRNPLTSLPSGMNLSNLTNGISMFLGNSLTSLPSGMNLSNLTNGISMFRNVTINTTRYSELLVDMEDLNSNNNVIFHGGNSEYNTTGETARDLLTTNQSWLFEDGGLE
jgi:hypothetical protein